MTKENEGNSEQVVEEVMDTMVEDSNADFFDALETQVNGAIQDAPAEQAVQEPVSDQVTPQVDSSSREVPQNSNWEDESNPYKVRYSDSTREAQRMKAENDKLKPYESLIGVLEQDAELVDIVRGYLDKGTKPDMKQSLDLGDDFVFDMDEAISDPDSKSAQVFNTIVDKRADQKAGDRIAVERQKAQQAAQKRNMQSQTKQFVDANKMNKDEFSELSKWAQTHQLSWDDINFLKNRDKANAKIASNSKQQVLDQMKNVQSMPATASAAGGENPGDRDHNDSIFDLIQKADNNLDNVFGE
tara:strand:+ start:400 stop:1299 length:900 start_codon:yes stop_codon:yes gene_type:complete